MGYAARGYLPVPTLAWDELLPMMDSGAVNPPIGTTYPLEDVRRALTDMAERRATGNSVLTLR